MQVAKYKIRIGSGMNFVAQMKRATKQVATECTLLLRHRPVFDTARFISELSTRLGIESLAVNSDGYAGSYRVISVNAAACNITIELTESVRPRAAYFEALDWPMLHRTFPEAEQLVTAHGAHVHVMVETEYDAILGADDIGLGGTNYARSRLAGTVVAVICEMAEPTAVHWKQGEMLYRPDQFLDGFENDPASVFVRATPFSSNREVRDVRLIGASTRGASGFMGTEAVLEEAPLPLEWIMETLRGFVSHCCDRGAYLPHLESYRPVEGDLIVVRHLAASPEIVEPHVSLEVRQAAAFGYHSVAAANENLIPVRRPEPWNGVERRSRPRSAATFGRRGLR